MEMGCGSSGSSYVVEEPKDGTEMQTITIAPRSARSQHGISSSHPSPQQSRRPSHRAPRLFHTPSGEQDEALTKLEQCLGISRNEIVIANVGELRDMIVTISVLTPDEIDLITAWVAVNSSDFQTVRQAMRSRYNLENMLQDEICDVTKE